MKLPLSGAARNTLMDRHIKGLRKKTILNNVLNKWDVN